MDLDEFEVEIKREFITEAIEMLEETESAFLDLENDPSDGKIMDKILRLAHTIKGSAYAAGFIELAEFAHVFETLLGMLRNSEIDVSEEVVDVLLYSNDALIKFIKILEKDSESVLDTFAAKEAISKLITDGGAELAVAPNVDSDSGSGFHLFDDDDKASTSEPVEKAEAYTHISQSAANK